MSTNVNSQSIMDANILPNFLDWLNNLRTFLKRERLVYVLVKLLSQSLAIDAPESVHKA